jgi:SPP1 gp7 family putative phage head morphogenesis protein
LKIAAAVRKPVLAYNWEGWWLRLRKDDSTDPPDDATKGWETLATQIIEDLWPEAGKTRAAELGVPFNPEDLAAALADTQAQVVGIADTLREQLRSVMRTAYDEQTTQYGFARQIRTVWDGVSKARAETIAVTEWNRAASAATYLGYTKQGVATKVWFTVGDSRVCSICEDNSAEGEIPISKEFPSGDLYPPAHPGCRCNLSAG